MRVRECGWGLECVGTSGLEGLEDVSTISNKQDRLEAIEETGAGGRVCFLSTELFNRGDVGFRRRRRALRRRSFAEVGGGVKVNEEGSDIGGEVDGREGIFLWMDHRQGCVWSPHIWF